ncbi:MAG: bL34 family ribosomal protein [Candidatus Gracilibacteria bacterium]
MLKKGNKRKRAKKHGFLKKSRSAGGRKVLKARRSRGRKNLVPKTRKK